MGEEEIELELKNDSVVPAKKNQVEKFVERNTERVIDILRKKNFEVIEPSQKSSKSRPNDSKQIKKNKCISKVLGLGGKGGVGKSTISAMIIRFLMEKNSSTILAVDSDPNTCLPTLLDSEGFETLGELIEGYKGGRLPPMKFKQEFESLLLRNEQQGFDLLPMGRSEGSGCYCSVNNLLQTAFRNCVLEGNYAYDYVVVDCEAGIEHISRKTSAYLTDFIIVTDGSRMGINTIENIYRTVKDVKIDIENIYVVANRVGKESVVKEVKEKSKELGFEFLGTVPEDEMVRKINFEGKSVFELPEDSKAYQKVRQMVKTILK